MLQKADPSKFTNDASCMFLNINPFPQDNSAAG